MKIFLITPFKSWDFGRSCARTLQHRNYSIKVYDYRREALSTRIFNYINYRFGIDKPIGFGNRLSNKKLKKEAEKFKPDLVITLKGEQVFPETIRWIKKELEVPTVLWFPDDPQHFEDTAIHIAPAYDYVFTNSIECVPRYKAIGVENVEYIPFGCDPEIHHTVNLSEKDFNRYKSDICFVGAQYPNRINTLSSLKNFNLQIWGPNWGEKHVPKELQQKWGGRPARLNEMAKIYSASKIALNIPLTENHINMKLFEITGCGAFMITSRMSGLDQLFRIGKEVICYESGQELVELIEYYLDNPEEREEIAKRGQERAHRDHTIEQRMKKIISVAEKL